MAFVDDAHGRAIGEGAAAEASVGGGELAGAFPYDVAATDFGELAGRIGAVNPDVLFVSAYLDDGVALRRAVVAAGIPLAANIGTSSSYCHPVFGDALGDAAVGLFASDKPDAADVRPDALDDEGRQALAWVTDRYQARYHQPMDAPALSGFANASALLTHVLPAAASLGPDDVAAEAGRVKLAPGNLANGFAPPPPYRWVNPPKEFSHANVKPKPLTDDLALDPDGSAIRGIATDDGQFVLNLPAGPIAPREGTTK